MKALNVVSSQIDWNAWQAPSEHFSAATGLCISAYDEAGNRRLGPHVHSRVGTVLWESDVWEEGQPGHALERELAQQAVQTGETAQGHFMDALCVEAVPVTLFGGRVGAFVYGWVFDAFGSSLTCTRIARSVGIHAPRLWKAVRGQSPVGVQRMKVFRELLETLISSNAKHLEALGRLQEVSRARDALIAHVSHDLRTPLSSLGMRLETLLADLPNDPKALREQLRAMQRNVREETRLVEDLLDAARTTTGTLQVTPAPCALGPLIAGSCASVEPLAAKRNVRLHVNEQASALPLTLHVDGHRMRQVLWNLLSNAVKYAPEGGEVSLEVHRRNGHVEIDVSDNGPGVSDELAERIFEPFERGPNQADTEGLGLGLSIAKQIVSLHDGELLLNSSPGAPTVFTVRLPATQDRGSASGTTAPA